MTKTVVALYDSATDAETVSAELSTAGFTDTEIVDHASLGSTSGSFSDTSVTDASLTTGTAGGILGSPLGAESSVGMAPAASGAVSDGILGRLRRSGVPEDESHVYAEGVRRGGALVIARLADDNVDRGLEIMSNHRPVDIDERGSSWRSEGWSSYDESAGPYGGTGLTDAATSMRGVNTASTASTTSTASTGLTGDRIHGDEETVIPIVEEQIAVGKREVEGGTVRVRSYVVETPVEESVRLRDESVHVERRKVDLPVDAATDAFRERTIDMRETSEEAVVSKTARVTEEVVISKDVNERIEQVSDTVRRTEVDIDRAADTNRTLKTGVDRDRDI
ncbi:hypothetical protein N825_04905 [Skermanella stibiiresistens SB22]|uniref:DUF2382 domain-containing protein n=1 Tax=Skermanella stibiiresistens SB22 TaxID=1385369 RepID=W9H0Y5_9PROT|nr:YsnF/AvaK domain-containing protein [Skermanella stibiiresistens]EWY39840.1 hypothetical protein N825_04905 [Skermanella stibiiresistens SB22]